MKNIKPREVPAELKLLRMLHPRMRMKPPDYQRYLNLEQGYAGELIMDAWLEDLSIDCLVINDVLLEQNRNLFQIDTLVIFQEKISVLDAKHNDGDFYIDGDKWKASSGTEIQDPLLQRKRSMTLLRKLLQSHRINIPIESFLVFTHPEFYLYNDSPQLPAVFPTQMPRFLKKMNSQTSRLGQKHEKIAEQLLALHKDENPRTRLPEYDYDGLKKGVVCSGCHSFMQYRRKTWFCSGCGMAEDNETVVMRSVAEYRLLFPDRKITTNAIYDWCGLSASTRNINRILAKNFYRIGHGIASYYSNRSKDQA
ncbi:NERD domain-containing protein [Salicibibacter cibarius]|uniref:NERD domain-containing protein n=1 Tax=Salicibibacter cibarius TaxID=2743000 RepID=A0A7T6Z6Q2_9BACI|nr:nuclease-related domain-containing protein [Salicibibacter cibarius]QQK77956.1 NERD domain-containing protein [Salicibibacter cibarius]